MYTKEGVSIWHTPLPLYSTEMFGRRKVKEECKEYDQQSFAFDLARLYTSGIEETKNGRRFQFGPSRKPEQAIRILDKDGIEQFLSTICFIDPEKE